MKDNQRRAMFAYLNRVRGYKRNRYNLTELPYTFAEKHGIDKPYLVYLNMTK